MPDSVNVAHTGNFGDWEIYDHTTPEGQTPKATPRSSTQGAEYSGDSVGDTEGCTPTPGSISEGWVVLEKEDIDATLQTATPDDPQPHDMQTSLPAGEAADNRANELKQELGDALEACLHKTFVALKDVLKLPSSDAVAAQVGDRIEPDMKAQLEAWTEKALAKSSDGVLTKESVEDIKAKLKTLGRYHVNLEKAVRYASRHIDSMFRKEDAKMKKYLADNLRLILSRETTKAALSQEVDGGAFMDMIDDLLRKEVEKEKIVSAMTKDVLKENQLIKLLKPMRERQVEALAKKAGLSAEEAEALCGKVVDQTLIGMKSSLLAKSSFEDLEPGTGLVSPKVISNFYASARHMIDEFVASRMAGLEAIDEMAADAVTKRLLRRAVLAGMKFDGVQDHKQVASDFVQQFKGLSLQAAEAVRLFCGGEMTADALKDVVQSQFPGTLPAVNSLIENLQESITIAQFMEVFQKAEAEYLK